MEKISSLLFFSFILGTTAQAFEVRGNGDGLSRFANEAVENARSGAHYDTIRKAGEICTNQQANSKANQLTEFQDTVTTGPDFPHYTYANVISSANFECVETQAKMNCNPAHYGCCSGQVCIEASEKTFSISSGPFESIGKDSHAVYEPKHCSSSWLDMYPQENADKNANTRCGHNAIRDSDYNMTYSLRAGGLICDIVATAQYVCDM